MMYEKLTIDKGQVFIIGDLHGEFSQLLDKLKEVNFNFEEDTLLSVGDLIDRGSENLECLRLMTTNYFHCVKGNHEELAYEGVVNGQLAAWFMNGGNWYCDIEDSHNDCEEGRNLIEWTANLPYILEVNIGNKKVVVCHADYPSDTYEYGKEVSTEEVVWSRSPILEIQRGRKVPKKEGADLFFFGHTPLNIAILNKNQYYLDTGACFRDGSLTIVDVRKALGDME